MTDRVPWDITGLGLKGLAVWGFWGLGFKGLGFRGFGVRDQGSIQQPGETHLVVCTSPCNLHPGSLKSLNH